MYISLYDIGIAIVFSLVVITGIYLIRAIQKLIAILDSVKRILAGNEMSLKETAALLPAVLSNVQQITESIKETAGHANETMDNVRIEWETFIVYARAVGQIIKALFYKGK